MIERDLEKAEQLRKDKNYGEAKRRYAKLWSISKDPKIGAGYLYCLRKLKDKKAVDFAYELRTMQLNHSWVNIEIFWTLLLLELKIIDDNSKAKSLYDYLLTMLSDSDDIALMRLKETMFNKAYNKKNWREANYWLDIIGKENLSDDTLSQSEWTERTLWFYRKSKCLFELKKYKDCISTLNEIGERFPSKFILKLFNRIKAQALGEIGELEESLMIYEELTKGRIEWWILREKAKILQKIGRKKDALEIFYIAASSSNQYNMLVKLYNDIGNLCFQLGMYREMLAHFILEKIIREKNSWTFNKNDEAIITSIIPLHPNFYQVKTLQDALNICREIWKESGIQIFSSTPKQKPRKEEEGITRKDLLGTVSLPNGKNYFFIQAEIGRIICFESEIRNELHDGDHVIFNVTPSFDKKRNEKSRKATDVKKI